MTQPPSELPPSGTTPRAEPTERAERITTRPPPVTDAVPRAAATGFGLPSELETAALVGKLSLDLKSFAADAEADRAESRAAIADGRAYYARQEARHAQNITILQRDIHGIHARLQEGDGLFRDLRSELEQTRSDRAADRETIAKLTDHIQGLSLQVQRASVSSAVAASHRELAGLVLLVLEDVEIVRTMVASVCEDFGARVLKAATIAEARQLVDGPSPPLDVVLVDLRIGDEDAMPFVRDLVRGNAVGVMILSGHLDEARTEEARALGVTCLSKPFDIAALVEAIRFSAARQR